MSKRRLRGFTLLEMVVVIVIVGIIAGILGAFLKAPVEGYFDTVRRAELTDEADVALRMVARDLQSALPNSITCGAGSLSFLPVVSGGRYREYPKSDGTGTPLAFGTAVTAFDTIGGSATSTTSDARGNAASGSIVVGNLSSGGGVCNAVAPADNIAALSAAPGSSVSITSTNFPTACQLQAATVQDDASTASINETNDREFGRFYVVNPAAVAYTCNSSGLKRNGVLLASHATSASPCAMACDGKNARIQTVSFALTLTSSGEAVTLLRQIHVVNLP